jgi:hypothetical protein
MAPSVAVPTWLEAMATAQPGNAVAMVAAVAGEEAGLDAKDPMEEDRYPVMCRFLILFFTCLRLIPVSTVGRFFFFFLSTQKEVFWASENIN